MADPLFVSSPMRPSWKQLLLASLLLSPTQDASAQSANPRFGRWLLKSDAPAPAKKI